MSMDFDLSMFGTRRRTGFVRPLAQAPGERGWAVPALGRGALPQARWDVQKRVLTVKSSPYP